MTEPTDVSEDVDTELSAIIDDLVARLDDAEAALASIVVEAVEPLPELAENKDDTTLGMAAPAYPAAPGESQSAVPGITAAVSAAVKRFTKPYEDRLGVTWVTATPHPNGYLDKINDRNFVVPASAFNEGTQRSTIAGTSDPVVYTSVTGWTQIVAGPDGASLHQIGSANTDPQHWATTAEAWDTIDTDPAQYGLAPASQTGPWPINVVDGTWATTPSVDPRTVIWEPGNSANTYRTNIVGQAVFGNRPVLNTATVVVYHDPIAGWGWHVSAAEPGDANGQQWSGVLASAAAASADDPEIFPPTAVIANEITQEIADVFRWDSPVDAPPHTDTGHAETAAAAKQAAIEAFNNLPVTQTFQPIATNQRPGLGWEARAAAAAAPTDWFDAPTNLGITNPDHLISAALEDWEADASVMSTGELAETFEALTARLRLPAGGNELGFAIAALQRAVTRDELSRRPNRVFPDTGHRPPPAEWDSARILAAAQTSGATGTPTILVTVVERSGYCRISRFPAVIAETELFLAAPAETQLISTTDPRAAAVAWGNSIAVDTTITVYDRDKSVAAANPNTPLNRLRWPVADSDIETNPELHRLGESLAIQYGENEDELRSAAMGLSQFTISHARAALNTWGPDYLVDNASVAIQLGDTTPLDDNPQVVAARYTIGTTSTIELTPGNRTPGWEPSGTPQTVSVTGHYNDHTLADLAETLAYHLAGDQTEVDVATSTTPVNGTEATATVIAPVGTQTLPHGAVATRGTQIQTLPPKTTVATARLALSDNTPNWRLGAAFDAPTTVIPFTAQGRQNWDRDNAANGFHDRAVAETELRSKAETRRHVRRTSESAIATTPPGEMPPHERAAASPTGAFLVAKDSYLSRIGVQAGQAVLVTYTSPTDGQILVVDDDQGTRSQRVKWSRFSDTDPATAPKVLVPEAVGNSAVRSKSQASGFTADRVAKAGETGAHVEIADNYLAKHGVPRGAVVNAVAINDRQASVIADGKPLTVSWARFTRRIPIADGAGGWTMRDPRAVQTASNSIAEAVGELTANAVSVAPPTTTSDDMTYHVGYGWDVTVSEPADGRYTVTRQKSGQPRGTMRNVTYDRLPTVVWAAAQTQQPFGTATPELDLAVFAPQDSLDVETGFGLLAAHGWVPHTDNAAVSPDGSMVIEAAVDNTGRLVWNTSATLPSAFGGTAPASHRTVDSALETAARATTERRGTEVDTTEQVTNETLADLAADPNMLITAAVTLNGEFVLNAAANDRSVSFPLATYPTRQQAEAAWAQTKHRLASTAVRSLLADAQRKSVYRREHIKVSARDVAVGDIYQGAMITAVGYDPDGYSIQTGSTSHRVHGTVAVQRLRGTPAGPLTTRPAVLSPDLTGSLSNTELELAIDTLAESEPAQWATDTIARLTRELKRRNNTGQERNLWMSDYPEGAIRLYQADGSDTFSAVQPDPATVSYTVYVVDPDTLPLEAQTALRNRRYNVPVTDTSTLRNVDVSTPAAAALQTLRNNPARYTAAWLNGAAHRYPAGSPDHTAIVARLGELDESSTPADVIVPAAVAGNTEPHRGIVETFAERYFAEPQTNVALEELDTKMAANRRRNVSAADIDNKLLEGWSLTDGTLPLPDEISAMTATQIDATKALFDANNEETNNV